jgi:hypothetical protein
MNTNQLTQQDIEKKIISTNAKITKLENDIKSGLQSGKLSAKKRELLEERLEDLNDLFIILNNQWQDLN